MLNYFFSCFIINVFHRPLTSYWQHSQLHFEEDCCLELSPLHVASLVFYLDFFTLNDRNGIRTRATEVTGA